MSTVPRNKQIVPSEHDEQASLFHWAEVMSRKHPELKLMFAIPNGGARNIVVARKLKAEGVKAGVPDIFLPVPRGEFHGLFIEMKRTKNGRVSDEQDEWLQSLALQGYNAYVCNGWMEAAKRIQAYLSEAL